ncbi:Ferritin-1 [Candidatus Providencia siddallii]|uniref:Ferritin n=1 Tax=Candidatus Providencia siddallii TaxID=1715285 RepID=A0A0M6W8Q8_9GAMM|nr:Ferritin-1 [Candidatus Providencia siddallii]
MINIEITKQLNKQLNLEFYSSNLYLQMSAWCSYKAYEGAASLLKNHSKEETEHMYRLFNYLIDSGELPIVGLIATPPIDFKSILDIFTQTCNHEKLITQNVNNLINLSLTSKDYATFTFLQWYITEQHEEENLFKSILEKLNMISESENGLFLIDNDLKKLSTIKYKNLKN